MIKGYKSENRRLRQVDDAVAQIEQTVWLDLLSPSEAEESALEAALGINIPTREEMEEIEISSRLYYEEDAAFMTATLPAGADQDAPEMAPVTFVLSGHRLITVRYHEPRAFETFAQRAGRVALDNADGEAVLIALLEAVIDRLADVLERAARDIDAISRAIFKHNGGRAGARGDLQTVLEEIGRKGDLTSNIRDTLVTLERLIGFLGQVVAQRGAQPGRRARVKTLARDGRSLTDHASFLSQKITFLLDATLGMLNIEQTAIIKIFSVAAVVFLPPTLVASIYGMNFDHMPELDWLLGYPFALGLMVASAVVPLWYFKRRGWL